MVCMIKKLSIAELAAHNAQFGKKNILIYQSKNGSFLNGALKQVCNVKTALGIL